MKNKKFVLYFRYLLFFFLIIQIVYSCVSFKGNKPVQTEIEEMINTVSIKVMSDSFSPNDDKISDYLVFELTNKKAEFNPVLNWELTIYNAEDKIVFTHKRKYDLPEEYVWNGKGNDNKVLSDGKYYAGLRVDFINGSFATEKSNEFYIDTTPPDIEVKEDKKYFSPDNDGIDDELTFQFVKANDMTGIKNWKLVILNPLTNKEFAVFSGDGSPKTDIIWNGIGNNGKLVESAEEYPVQIISEDLVGNKILKEVSPVLVDILVEKLGDGRYKIRVSSIRFKPNLPVMTDYERNMDILDLLANALKKFPEHKILIEGYANYWRKGLSEKRGYNLSYNRALLVSDELNKRGIEKDRMTVKGRGYENPIIPLRPNMTYEEKLEMGVNRRVEFYLEK